jgi:hypothetical protein
LSALLRSVEGQSFRTKTMQDCYEEDGVPNEGGYLPDGTYWTRSQSSVTVGTREPGPGNFLWEAVQSETFGANNTRYTRWQRTLTPALES